MSLENYLPKDYLDKLIKCPVCGEQFKGRGVIKTKKGIRYWGNKKYCSAYCRNKAWRDRNPRVRRSEFEEFRRWKNGQMGQSKPDFRPLQPIDFITGDIGEIAIIGLIRQSRYQSEHLTSLKFL